MRKILILAIAAYSSLTPTLAHAERIWEHTVHQGRDLLTPPQTSLECANWINVLGTDQCIGHALKCKYMNSRITIVVNGPSNEEIKNKVNHCGQSAIRDGIFAGLAALIVTSGADGFSTFLSTSGASFNACIRSIAGNAISLDYENPTHWDRDWGGC